MKRKPTGFVAVCQYGLCPLEKSSTSAVHFCKDCCYCFYTYKTDRKLDGNLMVQAINVMQSKGDWSKFIAFCYKRNTLGNDFMSWLFGNPAKFFELMERWLNEKV